jgi:hypothetical protein
VRYSGGLVLVSLQMPRADDSPRCRHLAAAEGQHATVEWLLSQGCDPNPVDRFSRTPLDVSLLCALYFEIICF